MISAQTLLHLGGRVKTPNGFPRGWGEGRLGALFKHLKTSAKFGAKGQGSKNGRLRKVGTLVWTRSLNRALLFLFKHFHQCVFPFSVRCRAKNDLEYQKALSQQ